MKELYLFSWRRDEFSYDVVVGLVPDSGKSIVRVQKCYKLMATSDRIEAMEKAFIYTVKKYIQSCHGMKFKDAKIKLSNNKLFIEMCDVFGNKLIELNTGRKI